MVTLNDVAYVPNLCVNLFNLNKSLKNGFKVSNDGVIVSLNQMRVRLIFDCMINATDGSVIGVSINQLKINKFTNASITNQRISNQLGMVVRKHSIAQ
jgi:hypothetical protein